MMKPFAWARLPGIAKHAKEDSAGGRPGEAGRELSGAEATVLPVLSLQRADS